MNKSFKPWVTLGQRQFLGNSVSSMPVPLIWRLPSWAKFSAQFSEYILWTPTSLTHRLPHRVYSFVESNNELCKAAEIDLFFIWKKEKVRGAFKMNRKNFFFLLLHIMMFVVQWLLSVYGSVWFCSVNLWVQIPCLVWISLFSYSEVSREPLLDPSARLL